MPQNTSIALPIDRYTRADFTALRAVMNKIPVERILDLYYCDDDRELLKLRTASDLYRRMDEMRENLIARVSDTKPHLVKFLQDARKSGVWSKSAIDYLVTAADENDASPRVGDSVSLWFKSPIANSLKSANIRVIADLAEIINVRGSGWYRPVPWLGALRARAIENWFQRYGTVSGLIKSGALLPAIRDPDKVIIDGSHGSLVLVPFEKIGLAHALSGADGINRNELFPMIEARDDLSAVRAYLDLYSGQPKTRRSYTKELERFLLWCVQYRRKPLSSVLQDDCKAYLDFLKKPDKSWVGPRAGRMSQKWKPFATATPLPASQRYAVTVLRAFFAWAIDVRYLSGNPWKAVPDPVVIEEENAMQIEKALPAKLWKKLSRKDGVLDRLAHQTDEELHSHFQPRGIAVTYPFAALMRVARAALLLMGETGLRREEAARASRDRLKPLREAPGLWELSVVGKGSKRRTVYVPEFVVDAIREHWADREGASNFDFPLDTSPLLSPDIIPPMKVARDRHFDDKGKRIYLPFTPDGMGRLASSTLSRLAANITIDTLDDDDRKVLEASAAHALRHTFGTLSVAEEVPLDVVQRTMGHASLSTTTIYVQAEKQRAITEMAKMHQARLAASGEE